MKSLLHRSLEPGDWGAASGGGGWQVVGTRPSAVQKILLEGDASC